MTQDRAKRVYNESGLRYIYKGFKVYKIRSKWYCLDIDRGGKPTLKRVKDLIDIYVYGKSLRNSNG